MKVLINNNLANYNFQYEVLNGEKIPHFESQARVNSIIENLRSDHEIVESEEVVDSELLFEVHKKDYVDFLKKVSSETPEDVLRFPSVFRFDRGSRSQSDIAKLGYYIFDTYTPLFKGAFDYAIQSASLSYHGAKLIAGGEKFVYTLCRPPGHHAESERGGGYCIINNSAIAAKFLSKNAKVSLLDVDFHHGNGAQEIFYSDSNVQTISIHADPNLKFPYFRGFEDELGESEGFGFNHNFPLGLGTGNSQYDSVLDLALEKIQDFSPEYVVVSFGTDTHEDDPVGGFKIKMDYYKEMSKKIKSLGLPVLVVQEGGYNLDTVGSIVSNFLAEF